MLAVQFDIVFPSLSQTNGDQNVTEILTIGISVTCNIFLNPPKSSSQSEKNSPNFYDNNNNNSENEVQNLVQCIIQPYFIFTNVPNLPKKDKYLLLPNKESSEQGPNLEKDPKETIPFRILGKNSSENDRVALLGEQVAGIGSEVSELPPKPTLLPLLGQVSDLLNVITPLNPPDLLPVSKSFVPAQPLFQSEVLIPEESSLSSVISPEPELVIKVRKILSEDSPHHVELCKDGVGGTYFVRDLRDPQPLAVFKPSDEEPGAELNPKNKLDNPLLPPGGGARREHAAYILDRGHAGVPETHLVDNLRHRKMSNGGSLPIPKFGSLQRFVTNKGDSTSMSPSKFLTDDVHAIAILDLRLLNLDRNGENLLIQDPDDNLPERTREGAVRLVPIDHSYILPPTLDIDPYFEWHYWRQTKEPLSPKCRKYVESLDPEQDAEYLRKAGFDEGSIRIMKISTLLLQKGVGVGLTLFDITNMVCRGRNKTSELSEIVARAEKNVPSTDFWPELISLIEQAVLSKKDRKPSS